MPRASSDRATSDSAELNLLRDWREPASSGRIVRAGIGSILVHIAIIVLLVSLPDIAPPPAPEAPVDVRKAVHLVAPKFFEPTQTAPNKGKVTRELDVRSSLPAPRPQEPRARPPAPAPGAMASAPPPPPPPAPNIPPPRIDPPKIEVPEAAPPQVTGTLPSPLPPPPPPQTKEKEKEKPKLAFESVGSAPRTAPNPNSQIPLPKTSVQEAVRGAAQPGDGGVIVGDTGDDLSILPNLSQPDAPGRVGSNLQLLSDAQGVDFKPYLIQILAAVRRNWLAIYPQSARMGRRGRVLIQFIVDRKGGVPKLVIADPSGTEAFDRAAVAGISASDPFPPLPGDYKGDQIRLQLTFSYNMPQR
jgi:TonB family protein